MMWPKKSMAEQELEPMLSASASLLQSLLQERTAEEISASLPWIHRTEPNSCWISILQDPHGCVYSTWWPSLERWPQAWLEQAFHATLRPACPVTSARQCISRGVCAVSLGGCLRRGVQTEQRGSMEYAMFVVLPLTFHLPFCLVI